MTDYAFVTRWRFRAPVEAVWAMLHDAEAWPAWWQGVERVEALAAGDASGIGAVRRFTWKSALPYRLRFDMRVTRLEKPLALEGEAFGELEGRGAWTLRSEGPWTSVRYDWNVRTTRAWMNALAPLFRGAFRWNHDRVMRRGAEGLARTLGCAWEVEAEGGPSQGGPGAG